MKEDLSKIVSVINRALAETEEQVSRRQMEEELEENKKELEKLQTESANMAGSDFN